MGKCGTCKEENLLTKEEFIEKVNLRLSSEGSRELDVSDLGEDVFSVISTVYTFHPVIDDVHGKDMIADLYVDYGISVIRDMLLRAERMKKLENQYKNIQSSLAALQEEMDSVSKGDRIGLF